MGHSSESSTTKSPAGVALRPTSTQPRPRSSKFSPTGSIEIITRRIDLILFLSERKMSTLFGAINGNRD